MEKIMNFLRKIGLLHVSKGDYTTGEFDDRKDINQEPAEAVSSETSGSDSSSDE